jgi:hypothetical protein
VINRMTRLIFASVLALLLAAPVAGAASRNQIIRDCADGSLEGNYSASEMRDARNNLPADVDEYTDCRDLLTRATHSGGKPSGGDGGGGGGTAVTSGAGNGEKLSPSSPEEEKALAAARGSAGNSAVVVDGERIVPGAAGFAADAARRGLPAPLVVLLVLLGVAALAGAVPVIRKRVLGRDQS